MFGLQAEDYKQIEEAIKEVGYLKIFRSGGGLRVVRDNEGKYYAESCDLNSAFQVLLKNIELGGNIDYHEIYGENKLFPHYLTGSGETNSYIEKAVCTGQRLEIYFDGYTFSARISLYIPERSRNLFKQADADKDVYGFAFKNAFGGFEIWRKEGNKWYSGVYQELGIMPSKELHSQRYENLISVFDDIETKIKRIYEYKVDDKDFVILR